MTRKKQSISNERDRKGTKNNNNDQGNTNESINKERDRKGKETTKKEEKG